MPICPTCSFRLKVTDERCENCGAAVVGAGTSVPPRRPLQKTQLQPEPLSPVDQDGTPILTPTLSLALRVVGAVISALGLVVTGYFWFRSEVGTVFFALFILLPVIALYRKSTPLLLGLAALSLVTGFSSCAANFRWAGG